MANLGAQFGRAKVWGLVENLLPADLNTEFNNLLNNLYPAKIGGNSATLAQMQSTTNPGTVGSENLQTNLQGELQTLRFMVQSITGGAQWYSAPSANLSTLSGNLSLPNNRVNSGRAVNDQPMFIIPSGTGTSFTLSATATNFSAYINGGLITFSADIASGALSLAPSTNNTCIVSEPNANGSEASKYLGERGTVIGYAGAGSSITALSGNYAAFKNQTTGEYFIAYVDTTNNVLRNCFRGFFFDQSDSWIGRSVMVSGDVIQLMKLTYIFGTDNSNVVGIDVTYNQPVFAVTAPSSPSLGDYWFNLTTQVWSKYTGVGFSAQSAVLIGVCIQDTVHCVAARSFDFYRAFSERNNAKVEWLGATQVRASERSTRTNVYGTEYWWGSDQLVFSSATDMESGATLTGNTLYFLYVTDVGDHKISPYRPYDRTFDLLGFYHPFKPWRCIGQVQTDSATNFIVTSVHFQSYLGNFESVPLPGPYDLQNVGLTVTAGSTGMTVTLQDRSLDSLAPTSKLQLSFRSPNATSGNFLTRSYGAPLALNVPTGASLGLIPTVPDTLNVFVADATTLGAPSKAFLCISASKYYDENLLQNVSAIVASSGSRYLLWSSSALSNVPIRYIGQILMNQSTSGSWANAPTSAGIMPIRGKQIYSEVWVTSGNGHGGSNLVTRRLSKLAINVGTAITYNDTASTGTWFQINEEGLYSINYVDGRGGGGWYAGLLRSPGALAAAQGILSIRYPNLSTTGAVLGFMGNAAGLPASLSVTERLLPGDSIYCQTDGGPDSNEWTSCRIIKIGD